MINEKISPLKSFKIIKEMYEHFVKAYRELEPKLMICEIEDFKNVETALKEKQEQDNIIHILKDIIEFDKTLPQIKTNDDGSAFELIQSVGMRVQRDIENEERKQLREWILKTCFPKELKALDIIKDLFDFDFAIRFGTNQLMLMITNNRTKEYWYFPISKEEYDLLKEVLL